ncbi:AJAP1 protein, partial [Anhinga anhinga]|nr:AJAP1 protein [Anhinga anhinga]
PGCFRAFLTQSLSVCRSSCPLGSHAWILIAMFHLAMDLASCQPPASSAGGRLSPRPVLRHRLSRGSLWGAGTLEDAGCAPPSRNPSAFILGVSAFAPPDARALRSPGQVPGHPSPSHRSFPSSSLPSSLVPVAGCCRHASSGAGSEAFPASDRYPSAWHQARGVSVRGGGLCSPLPGVPLGSPPHSLSFLFSAGLAVHQIITITVSLIMVIAALITTLVLKNCCAQSGRPRRNSHQRKLDQQEESCQNLTDFAPARVPSTLDIFTAYNETLQCSHECVRTPVPVYAEEALHSPGDYKTTFNGNRPSSSDRHLIPVAFVSEKWFEISC